MEIMEGGKLCLTDARHRDGALASSGVRRASPDTEQAAPWVKGDRADVPAHRERVMDREPGGLAKVIGH